MQVKTKINQSPLPDGMYACMHVQSNKNGTHLYKN